MPIPHHFAFWRALPALAGGLSAPAAAVLSPRAVSTAATERPASRARRNAARSAGRMASGMT